MGVLAACTGNHCRSQVTERLLDADLVLALTRRHRGQAVVLHPPASRYSFTLGEVERMLPSRAASPVTTRWNGCAPCRPRSPPHEVSSPCPTPGWTT